MSDSHECDYEACISADYSIPMAFVNARGRVKVHPLVEKMRRAILKAQRLDMARPPEPRREPPEGPGEVVPLR